MTFKVAGILGATSVRAAAPCPAGSTRIALGSGYVDVTRSLPIAQVDDQVCVALGSPRFVHAGDRAMAIAQSPAAAWLATFRRHGVEAPGHVLGRFAVVLLNARDTTLFLAVDRFGTWPMCYGVHGASLAFSDRADCVPGVRREISHQSLFEYFYFHVIPAPRTVFEGIERLPAGHAVRWDHQGARRHRYWTVRFAESHTGDLAQLKTEFRGLLHESVVREAEGHRVGAFLSGGTDSSTVAGMLTQVLGTPARTYSIGFDAGGYDEMAYARIAARHFGTDHHEYYVTPDDLLAGIPKVAAHYDQPFGNSSAVPAWICAGLGAADGVDKMLAGDGGDELFGGNTRYAKQRVFNWYDRVPRAVRQRLIEPLLAMRGLGGLPPFRKAGSYVEQARVPMPDRTQMYNLLARLGPDNVFTPRFQHRIDQDAPLAAQRVAWHSIEARTLTNRMLAYDWKYTLADNDLPKVIGSAELAGVDVGFPLLSDELVAFSLALPPEWKLKRLTLRWFFKEALRGFLPDAIISKKKHGFGLPFGLWTVQNDALGRMASNALEAFGARGVIRADFLRELIGRWMREHPGYYGEMVWIIVVIEHWMQAHAPDWRLED